MGILNKFGSKPKKIRSSKQEDTNVLHMGADIMRTPQKSETRKLSNEPLKQLHREPPRERMSDQVREIGELKQELAKMSTSLRESIRLNQGTVGEVEKLSGFLKTAELNTLSLERIQPENAQLKTKLDVLQAELTKKGAWANELESKATAYKSRFDEAQLVLENSRAQIVDQQEALREHVVKRSDMSAELDILQDEKHSLYTNVESLKTSYAILQEDMASVQQSGILLSRQNTELEKQADLINARVDTEREGREAALSDLKTIRLDFAQEKAAHIESLSKLDKARYSSTADQNALSEVQQRSDDKIFALNASIDGLKTQLKVNSEMSSYDALEKTKFKALSERDARRVEEVSSRLEQKTIELAENQTALVSMKANYDELNQKFLELLSEMEVLRGDHSKQSKKLEEYSSITGIAVGQSFYEDRSDVPNLTLVKDSD